MPYFVTSEEPAGAEVIAHFADKAAAYDYEKRATAEEPSPGCSRIRVRDSLAGVYFGDVPPVSEGLALANPMLAAAVARELARIAAELDRERDAAERKAADLESRYRAESLECNRLRERLMRAESDVAAYREQRDAEGERAKRAEALAESRLAEAAEFRTRHATAEARADRWRKACEESEADANRIARQRNAEIAAHNECADSLGRLCGAIASVAIGELRATAGGRAIVSAYLAAAHLADESTGERHARHAKPESGE